MSAHSVTHRCTTLVLGSGVAGLTYALRAVQFGPVLILTKKSRSDSSTNRAQGGLAAVLSPTDSFDLHVADTLEAGAGLCRRDVVEAVVREGPALIRSLTELGATFAHRDGDSEGLDLGLEGGHSRRRIVHSKDRTGQEIESTLLAAVAKHPEITVLEQHLALDLWVGAAEVGRRCYGASFLDQETGATGLVRADHTMLSTGGCGKVYRYTTNPDIATADGVAMAARAGCSLGNMEMVQFHPTCLHHSEAKSFLISEAVRGEGAVLRNLAGDEFMEGLHPLGSLAPRDVVAREIDRETKRRGDKFVFLDASSIGEKRFRERFPAISARLETFGIVGGRDPIPVVPAAHYMCGGVVVDLDGRTEVEGLFASGEVAFTGVHGANRLASNSLLEASVLAERAGGITPQPAEGPEPPPPPPPGTNPPLPDQGVILDHEWDAVRSLMLNYMGLVRSRGRLDRAVTRLAEMKEWSGDLYRTSQPSSDLTELRNISLAGLIMATAARAREESRGLHTRVDFPETDPVPRESWSRVGEGGVEVTLRPLES
ncbi:MAG TPA: L-aspartate oxidase [Gemmatimonadetes bacterium]|nr:L-aspartate oxidase [Gemmatimonadota bacterium]